MRIRCPSRGELLSRVLRLPARTSYAVLFGSTFLGIGEVKLDFAVISAVIEDEIGIEEFAGFSRKQAGDMNPADLQEILRHLFSELLSHTGKPVAFFPELEIAVVIRAIEIALPFIDERTTTRAFADDFPA